jgi:hypothetical protein
MSVDEFLRSTPPEINIKVDAWKAARKAEAIRDYNLASIIVTGFRSPEKFPPFARFYPEVGVVEGHVKKAISTATKAGDL